MTQFTANEVRELAATIWPDLSGREEVAEALNAFSDLLEAREQVVPVAYAEFADNGCVRMWSRGYEERLPGTRMIPLYTHPAPSDAERLAEALQPFANLFQALYATMSDDRPIYGINKAEITAGDLRRANEALAAHAAQAQPPAVSMTDAIARRMVAEYDAVLCGDPTATRTDGMRAALEAALATQENPNGF